MERGSQNSRCAVGGKVDRRKACRKNKSLELRPTDNRRSEQEEPETVLLESEDRTTGMKEEI